MSQSSVVVANGTGLAVRGAINDALMALTTLQSGTSAPSPCYPYQLWVDTSVTPNVLRMRNPANDAWLVVATVSSTACTTTSIPAGVIAPYAGQTVPSGWLECNGAEVAISSYGTLATALYVGDGNNADTDLVYGYKTNGSGTRSTSGTHIKLPDLRGEFVRGWDHNRAVDNNRKLGSYQADDYKAHTHTIPYASASNLGVGVIAQSIALHSGDTGTSPVTGGTETRPRNVSAHYIIKY